MNIIASQKADIADYGSDLTTEIVAGVSLYLSLAYIFIVNPAILSQAGIPSGAVFFATVTVSAIATLAMGLYARLPFALAPGLETNGFIAFVVVAGLGFSWQAALGLVFWSGALCLIFTIFPIRQRIIDSIPIGLKSSIAVMVGVFVALIGLVIADVLSFESGLVAGLGELGSGKPVLLCVGLVLTIVLNTKRFRFSGGMLVAIIASAIVGRFLGISSDTPAAETGDFLKAFGALELWGIFVDPRSWPILLVLFMIDFYGSISKFIALTTGTTLQAQDGTVKNMKQALYVDGAATMVGAAAGTTTMITYVESAVAIESGGRTGVAAIVCSALMGASLVFTPLVGVVPVAATSGVLVYVGYLLLRPVSERYREGVIGSVDIWIGLLMGLVTLLTFSLDKPMLLGFLLYTILDGVRTRGIPNLYLLGSSVILTGAMAAQYFGLSS